MTVTFSTLGDVAEFINGAAFKPEDWGEIGNKIIRIQNLTDKSKPFNRTTRQINERLHVHPGDLLVSWSATLGIFEWEDSEVGLLNQHIFRVLPDPNKVDKRYLRHALELALLDMRKHMHGATMLHVNRGEFLATKLYLPPLPEQRRIAAILDQADALRAKRREALAQLDSLTQSIFIEMFGDPVTNPKGWERVQFGELLDSIESGWSPICLDKAASGDEWGVLKLGAITQCDYKDSENKALPPNIEPRNELEVKPGDLLFTRKNTYELVAACALVRSTRPKLLIPDLIFRFRFKDRAKIDSCFLHQLLINPAKRRSLQKLASGSAGSMPNISKARLLAAEIELPPLSLQTEFAYRALAVEQQRTIQRNSLNQLDSLFASLQHRALRGEL